MSSRQKAAVVALLACLGAVAAAAQEIIDIRRLGTRNSFCGFPIDDGRDLGLFLSQYAGDVDQILRSAGLEADSKLLISALADGRVREVRVPVGTELRWMAARKNGRPTILERVRWAGTEPFEAFEIPLGAGCSEHRLLVPKSCGNLALLSTRSASPPSAPGLGVRQSGRCAGERVTVDLTHPGGDDSDLQLTLSRPDGSVQILALDPAEAGARWSAVVTEPGSYTLGATARNACGASEPLLQTFTIEACAPTCSLRLAPANGAGAGPGRATVYVDLSASRGEEAELASASVAVYRNGSLVDRIEMSGLPYRTEWVVPDYGLYRFQGEVRDERGASSSGDCSASFALQERERPRVRALVSLFGGVERRWRAVEGVPAEQIADQSAALAGGTAGAAFPITRSFALFAQFGGAVNFEETGNSSLFVDAGFDVFLDRTFFGAGVGYWDLNDTETRDGTLLVHGGVDTPWTFLGLTVQWFAEGRLFFDMIDMIDNNYVGVTGIRLR